MNRPLALVLLVGLILAWTVGCDESKPPTGFVDVPNTSEWRLAPEGLNNVADGAINHLGDVAIVGRHSNGMSWLLLLDDQGEEIEYRTDLEAWAGAVCPAPDGGWYVAGGHFSLLPDNGWLLRIEADGSDRWQRGHAGLGVREVLPHSSSGAVILTETAPNEHDIAFIRFDDFGNEIWQVDVSTDYTDVPSAMTRRPNGDYFAAVYLEGTPFAFGTPTLVSVSADGELSTPMYMLGTAGDPKFGGVAAVDGSQTAVAGFDRGPNGRLWLRLFNAGGVWGSDAHYGTASDQSVTCVAALGSDYVITAGSQAGTLDGDVDLFISVHDIANADRISSVHGLDSVDEEAIAAIADPRGNFVRIIGETRQPGADTVGIIVKSITP